MFLAATTSLVGAVFTFFFIPKTKDKSMYELEMLFVRKKGGSNEGNMNSACGLFDRNTILTSEKKIENE